MLVNYSTVLSGSVCGQRSHVSDCAGAQADLGFCCLRCREAHFSLAGLGCTFTYSFFWFVFLFFFKYSGGVLYRSSVRPSALHFRSLTSRYFFMNFINFSQALTLGRRGWAWFKSRFRIRSIP